MPNTKYSISFTKRCVLLGLTAVGAGLVTGLRPPSLFGGGALFGDGARADGSDSGPALSYTVEEVADGVFVHIGRHELQSASNRGDISNSGFVVGSDGVAVIDTGGSFVTGAALLEAVKSHTEKPVLALVNTHMHPDHVLGNAAFSGAKPVFYAHTKMARALQARSVRYLQAARDAFGDAVFAGTEVVLPGVGVAKPTEIDLGGRTLRLSPQHTAHTDNDLFIVDSKTGIAFAGDLIFSGHVPSLDGSILGWQKVLAGLSNSAPNGVVPGHGPARMDWQPAYEPMKRYLEAVTRDVRAVIERGGTITEAMKSAARDELERWELFDDFHARNVSAAFAELEWE